MCIECANAVREHFPHLTHEEHMSLLWGATAFPFADGETTAEQVAEMARKSGGELGSALAIADHENDEAMKLYQARKRANPCEQK